MTLIIVVSPTRTKKATSLATFLEKCLEACLILWRRLPGNWYIRIVKRLFFSSTIYTYWWQYGKPKPKSLNWLGRFWLGSISKRVSSSRPWARPTLRPSRLFFHGSAENRGPRFPLKGQPPASARLHSSSTIAGTISPLPLSQLLSLCSRDGVSARCTYVALLASLLCAIWPIEDLGSIYDFRCT